MSTFPTGIAVITTVDRHGDPLGLTCSAVCSVSLRPPLLLVCIRNTSSTLAAIQDRGAFAINLLHDGGREAADLFSSLLPNRFRYVTWVPTQGLALPGLTAHAHTVAECKVWDVRVTGDHTVVIGDVAFVSAVTTPAPLVHGLHQYLAWPIGDHLVARTTSGDSSNGSAARRQQSWH